MSLAEQANAGWYTDPRNPEVMLWWDGRTWRDADRQLPPNENWFVHFLKFAFSMVVLYFALALIVGLVALPFALSVTGRRPRDFFALLIPIWGAVILIQTMWRLSANRICWLPRHDRLSRPMFGPAILSKSVFPPEARDWLGI